MRKTWDDEAWEDYLSWQTENRKILRRINALLKDIERNGALHGTRDGKDIKKLGTVPDNVVR